MFPYFCVPQYQLYQSTSAVYTVYTLGRRDDSKYNRASREEARFREAEWDNYLRHGPRGHAEYHHGFEHCI